MIIYLYFLYILSSWMLFPSASTLSLPRRLAEKTALDTTSTIHHNIALGTLDFPPTISLTSPE